MKSFVILSGLLSTAAAAACKAKPASSYPVNTGIISSSSSSSDSVSSSSTATTSVTSSSSTDIITITSSSSSSESSSSTETSSIPDSSSSETSSTTVSSTTTVSTCPAFVTPSCARDNCLRAVIACRAAPGPESALADCSSYAQVTVTEPPVTVTATAVETVIATPMITAPPLVCYADNCVRAFLRFSTDAEPFCATFTTTVNTDSVLPSFAMNCPSAASALSSGCSCLDAINSVSSTAAPVPSAKARRRVIKRQAAVAAVPTYASACSGSVRYSSACSCLGITATTTTEPATTTTVTTTSTTTIASV